MQLLVLRRAVTTLALSLAVITLGACGEATGPNGEKIVKVEDNVFNPQTKNIAAGETVLWEWAGAVDHNVTWADPSGVSNSPTQKTGTFTRTFSNTGTFNYVCTIHESLGMRGSIVVQSAGY